VHSFLRTSRVYCCPNQLAFRILEFNGFSVPEETRGISYGKCKIMRQVMFAQDNLVVCLLNLSIGQRLVCIGVGFGHKFFAQT